MLVKVYLVFNITFVFLISISLAGCMIMWNEDAQLEFRKLKLKDYIVGFKKAIMFLFLFMYVCVCHVCMGACGRHKRISHLLELEL